MCSGVHFFLISLAFKVLLMESDLMDDDWLHQKWGVCIGQVCRPVLDTSGPSHGNRTEQSPAPDDVSGVVFGKLWCVQERYILPLTKWEMVVSKISQWAVMKSSRKPHSFGLKDIKKCIWHSVNSLFFYEERRSAFRWVKHRFRAHTCFVHSSLPARLVSVWPSASRATFLMFVYLNKLGAAWP